MEKTYTISNIAGGDLRRFRTVDGGPSDASIRHAKRQGSMGYTCSDADIREQIDEALDEAEQADL